MVNSDNKPLVSVIVPVYNTERCVGACLESLLAQTYDQIEIVVIDDGSKDGSLEVCRRYEHDPRVHVYMSSHHGATSARRKGMMVAHGEWVMFVDSDDILYPRTIEKMMALTKNVDIVIGASDGDLLYFQTLPRYIGRDQYLRRWGKARFRGFLWGKLYRRTLFNEKTFDLPDAIVMGEDVLVNFRLAIANQKPVRVYKHQTCQHRAHADSVYHTFRPTFDYYHLFHWHLRSIIEKEVPAQTCAEWLRTWEEEYFLWVLKSQDYIKFPAWKMVISGDGGPHPFIRDFAENLKVVGGWHPLNQLLVTSDNPRVLRQVRWLIKLWNRLKGPSQLIKDLDAKIDRYL